MGRLSEEKVFKDPVHRYVHVREELIWKLIDTAEFQRLNRIRQLGNVVYDVSRRGAQPF